MQFPVWVSYSLRAKAGLEEIEKWIVFRSLEWSLFEVLELVLTSKSSALIGIGHLSKSFQWEHTVIVTAKKWTYMLNTITPSSVYNLDFPVTVIFLTAWRAPLRAEQIPWYLRSKAV